MGRVKVRVRVRVIVRVNPYPNPNPDLNHNQPEESQSETRIPDLSYGRKKNTASRFLRRLGLSLRRYPRTPGCDLTRRSLGSFHLSFRRARHLVSERG